MKINEILKFNRDSFFDGAVQIDWFYNDSIRREVAKSYVFHGKEYHGINKRENLIDTAGYVRRIIEKLYVDKNSNRFLLTIAGYGTGKSHLGVTLGSLLKENNEERNNILKKIKEVDFESGKYIESNIGNKNLVITLNGMNDFNLNYQILKNAKLALKLHDVDTKFLEDMTKAYETAEHFLERNYSIFEDEFIKESKKVKKYALKDKDSLKISLLENIRQDQEAFDIVNEVYKIMTSNYIKWDEGISAGDILLKINNKVCIEDKIFDNIVIIFDEFGRFIEYAGVAGVLSGESALQQIFESVQNANKNILFIGLIQSDLNAYLSRVEKSSNIIRYVGRYETSEKIYISSNLETILANLILKKDFEKFQLAIGNKLRIYESYYSKMYECINRWLPNSTTIWKNKSLFDKVIKEGAYPLNPLTVWLLSNSSDWMQQRSTLTFAEEIFVKYGEVELFEDKLPQIYPIELIESKFFDELLNSEEKGIQNSQYCIIFKIILSKYEDKLTLSQKKILEAILISNIGKFKFFDKEDNILGLKYISGIFEKIEDLLISLENEFGIISYDKSINRYELISEGNGLNEFRLYFSKQKIMNRINTIKIVDQELIEDIGLDKAIEPRFSLDNGIKTNEWNANKQFIDIKDLNDTYIRGIINQHLNATDGEKAKGIVLFIYLDSISYKLEDLKNMFKSYNVFDYPIIISILKDTDNEMKEAYKNFKILKLFSLEDRKRFGKIYIDELQKARIQVTRKFTILTNKRLFLTNNGVEKFESRLTNYYNEVLEKQYPKAIPFIFDGFDKKILGKTIGYYKQILEIFLNGNYTNKQLIQSLNSDVKNRLDACLREDYRNSWGIFTVDYRLTKPNNVNLYDIVEEIENEIEKNDDISGKKLLSKYLRSPYGMNLYQLILLVVYIIVRNKNIKLSNGIKNIKRVDLINHIFVKSKKNLEFLLECKYSMIELNMKEKFKKIFKDIQENKFSENCSKLDNELKILLENELDEELQDEYILASERIRKGFEVEKKIIESIEKFNQNIKKISVNFDLYVALKYMSEINKMNKIKLEADYIYSENRISKFNSQYSEIKNIILNLSPQYIENIKFTIRDISEKEKKYTSISNALKKIGFNKLAEDLQKKVSSIIEEINIEEEFKEMNNRIDEIIFNTKTLPKNYEMVEVYLEQVKLLKEILDKENIPTSIRNKNYIRLIELEDKLISDRNQMEKFQLEIINLYENLLNNEDVLNLESKINNINKLNIVNSNSKDIENIINKLNIFKAVKKEIINLSDNIQEIENKLKIIVSKEELKPFINVIKSLIDNKKQQILLKEKKWIEKYLTISLENIQLDKCNKWINETEILPDFLSCETIDRYKVIRIKIDDIITNYKIDGVIMMFKKLSIGEQKECIKILMDSI